MSKMGEELDRLLDEHKHEMYEALQRIANSPFLTKFMMRLAAQGVLSKIKLEEPDLYAQVLAEDYGSGGDV